jgi:hypothetical protein
MSSDIYVGDVYSVDPKSVRFDQTIVEFNRVQDDNEYTQTKLSIQSVGQQTPIVINSDTGLCENGRHRVRACAELGIQVKCIQIDGSVPIGVKLELYNLEQMSGKELTVGQKAIQAHKYAKIAKVNLDTAAKKYNVNKRTVNAANTIAGLGRDDILQAVHTKGYWLDSTNKKVKDLRSIASQLKAEKEELVEDEPKVSINYEDMILTEKGKAEFWKKRTLVTMSQHELDIMLVEYMNMKYKLVVDTETGEINEK